MVTSDGRANTCRRKFKAPRSQTKVQKMKELPKIRFTQKPYPSASRCADPEIAPDLPKRTVNLLWQSMKIFCNIFQKKLLSELEKNGSAIFYSGPRMKVEITREIVKTVEIHLTRDQKLHLTTISKNSWNCPRKTNAFGWSSVSDAFCNRLSYIEPTNSQDKPQYLRRRNILLYFRREFHWKKPEKKTRDSTKKCSNFFMTSHKLSTPWQKSGRLGLEEKNWWLWNRQKILNNFDLFRQQ